MGTIAYLIGAFVGGLMAMALIGWVLGKFLFRKAEPEHRDALISSFAWGITGLIGAWGLADGAGLVWSAWLFYIPSAVVYYLLRKRRAVGAY